jgi:integrase
MSRRPRVPSYRLHKQSGQAVVTLPDGLGGRRDVLLGKYDSEESKAEYVRLIAEWQAAGHRPPPVVAAGEDRSVNELMLAFLPHAEQHYRHPDGTPTNELNDFRLSLRPLKELYGHTPVKDFGPLALKAVRVKMIDSGLCRGVVNQRIGRIRRMFKWGVENELVPPSVLQGLQAVRGLARGRSAARETEPVQPVPEAFVYAVLPHVRPQVAAMVQLQLHTGMRPGEVVIIRAIDIDMTGKVWLYRPGSDRGPEGTHKTAYRGRKRIIPIGPRGQEILRPHLKTDLYAYLFSPREAVDALRAEQRRKRKTRVQPSQVDRRKPKPKRKPGERYRARSYAVAIARGIVAANRTRACDACKNLAPENRCEKCQAAAIPHWHPHQVRHTKATEIRREAGLDAARAVLGHTSPAVTEVYAEIDLDKATQIMERLG